MLVSEASEKIDGEESGNHVLSGVVEEEKVRRIEEDAERREPKVRAERERDRRTGQPADEEHHRRGDQEAPEERDLRIDGAELELQRQPGRAPDEHGGAEEAEIAR